MSRKRQRDEHRDEINEKAKEYYQRNKDVMIEKSNKRKKYIRDRLIFDEIKKQFLRCQVCDRVLMNIEKPNGICNSCKAIEEIEDIRRILNEKR